MPAAIHEAMEEWMGEVPAVPLEPVLVPPAEAVAPVPAPVFAPAVELASVPPADAPPVVPPGPESAERAVDVSGLMLRLRGPGPVEKAKQDLAKVLAGPKVLGRRPSKTPEGEMCRHRLLFCQECHGR